METRFNKEDLEFYLPNSFRGMSKQYILDAVFDDDLQKSWVPAVGDAIVGPTGNIFVISGAHLMHEDLGGHVIHLWRWHVLTRRVCIHDGDVLLHDEQRWEVDNVGGR